MDRLLINKKGFTLVELSISAGLLSLVVFAVTMIYSNSSNAFKASSWRMTRQKEAQKLLVHFKECVEKSSHFNIIKSTGEKHKEQVVNVKITKPYFNKLASATNTGILFASHCTPLIQSNPKLLHTNTVQAVFKGYSLECYDHVLSSIQTCNNEFLMKTVPTYPTDCLPPLENPDILKNNHESDSIFTVEDVDSIRVNVATDSADFSSGTCLITLQIKMVMPRTKGDTSITEEITARLSDRDNDVLCGLDSYPSNGRRK